jgi:hypothetical protein
LFKNISNTEPNHFGKCCHSFHQACIREDKYWCKKCVCDIYYSRYNKTFKIGLAEKQREKQRRDKEFDKECVAEQRIMRNIEQFLIDVENIPSGKFVEKIIVTTNLFICINTDKDMAWFFQKYGSFNETIQKKILYLQDSIESEKAKFLTVCDLLNKEMEKTLEIYDNEFRSQSAMTKASRV